MAKPWKKHKRWPHVARSGARSYCVGFYDHEGVERARSFPAARAARGWMEDYVTAERLGPDSLRRFLLDLDAREANATTEVRTIGEVIQLYFAFNAPDTADGLATSSVLESRWAQGCSIWSALVAGGRGSTRSTRGSLGVELWLAAAGASHLPGEAPPCATLPRAVRRAHPAD